MQSLFDYLSQASATHGLVAIVAAWIWGILSMLLSPCHMASIPLVVGYIHQQVSEEYGHQ